MIKKCLFPVAGYGTRFLPATKAMPKEMLPIVNKPLVQYGVEEAIAAGLDQIGFVTGRGKRAINDHFDVSYELEHQIAGTEKEKYLTCIREVIQQATFATTRQPEMKGLGHAILVGELLVGYEPFGVVLADDLCLVDEGQDNVLEQLVKIYRRFGKSVVAITEVPAEDVSKFGVIQGELLEDDLYTVTDMVEKPRPEEAPSNLAIIGRYVLTPDIFEALRNTAPGRNGEIQITDALCKLAKKGRVLAYRFKGRRFDCGSVEGYVEATNYVYENIYRKQNP
ncbi:MAG: UTP--glucose-1-phosphate uridylyltransferase GalU [Porticoccaceae bacterium]